MSRINKKKGLEAIFKLAESLGKNVTIDFYGPILEKDKAYFLAGVQRSPQTEYRGVLEPSEIYKTLSNYDVLLFPTQYYTEGLPGAIIDAYFSGLTVVASNWQHAHEFIRQNETGLIFEWNNVQEFIHQVLELTKNPAEIERLKSNASKEATKYTAEFAWTKISGALVE